MADIVEVEVDGGRFSAWEEASVTGSQKEAARSFRLKAAAEQGGRALKEQFKVGAKVKIYLGGDLVCSGFVDSYNPSLTATTATVTISGRSKGGDAVDSSVKHKTGRFKKKKPDAIAKEMVKETGIDVDITSDADDLEEIDYQVTPGETVFRAVEKMARQQGKTLSGQADGSIKITDAKKAKRQSGSLVEGRNIKSGEANHNGANRHSEYIVKGQAPIGHGTDALEIEAVAKDSEVKRKRPVIVVQDQDTDKKRTKKRAKHRRDKAAGDGLKATITVQGWRDESGALWEPGKLVWTESPFLALEQEMLIESVIYSQDGSSGSETKLSLVDPRAHGGKKGKGGKSGSDWNQDDSEAE